MAVQIKYRALPLRDLFSELSRTAGGSFLQLTMYYVQFTTNYREAWNKAASELFTVDEDRELLTSIGSSLGSSDTAGQAAMLERSRELLSARLREAAEISAKKGSMYRSVGLLTGLGIAIVVI
jgi:stage III sporulation protein AB